MVKPVLVIIIVKNVDKPKIGEAGLEKDTDRLDDAI